VIGHEVIERHARRAPERLAIIDRNRALNWLEFADAVGRCAGALASLLRDVDRPHRVAFLGENNVEVLVLQAAAATLGVPIVGVDHSLTVPDVGRCVSQLDPTVLAASPAWHSLACAALRDLAKPPEILLRLGDDDAGGEGWISGGKLMSGGVWPMTDSWYRPPFAAYGFTSGTSGTPKLVLRGESFAARRHADVTRLFGIDERDVYLNAVTLFHASAPGWARIFLTEGATLVLADARDLESLARLASEHAATFTLMSPQVLTGYTAKARELPASPPPLRAIVTGGRHVSPRLVRDATSTFGEVLHVYYGTTETGLNTLATPRDLAADPLTAGRPLPGNEVAILDGDNHRVRAGVAGRVAISGYMLADHFGDGSSPSVDLEGVRYWVTADAGVLDSDGRLRILGRDLGDSIQDVIRTEALLREIDGISDAAVAVVDDGEGGAEGSGAVALVAYVVDARAAAARESLAERVAGVASASLVGISTHCLEVPEIPYSASGKVRPRDLRAIFGRSSGDLRAVLR
jgi:acyl-coenzyme A synthetase/AMP-(fatty) acid ligase